MNKKFKKLCSVALTLAITATSAISMSVSAFDYSYYDIRSFSDFTIIDDKGMMNDSYTCEGYKMLYRNHHLLQAEPNFNVLKFVLSEDVNYEEVNDRIIEIFEEFYPDNYLGVSELPPEGPPQNQEDYPAYIEYVENYRKNYKPNLFSNTVDGITTYTVCVAGQKVTSINDERVAEARKYSKDFMKKLNEEKLISAFYDFGEVYYADGTYVVDISYSSDVDIDLIYNYIDEHNIDCTIKKDDIFYDRYKLEFNDDTDELGQFLIAVDIYEETSIKVDRWYILDSSSYGDLYGKNALEDLETIIGDANGDGYVSIRDAAFIAILCAKRQYDDIPECADFNGDGKRNIRDAASIAIWFAREAIEQ